MALIFIANTTRQRNFYYTGLPVYIVCSRKTPENVRIAESRVPGALPPDFPPAVIYPRIGNESAPERT